MAARQKPIRIITPKSINIDLSEFSEKNKEAIEKDMCLLELALESDRVIVSRDRALYDALGTAGPGIKLRDMIRWHNPVSDGCSEL